MYRNCGQVGMARSRCGNYIFANYLPAGNMQVITGCLKLVAWVSDEVLESIKILM